MADVSYRDLCLDANRPEVVAAFWSPVLGRELHLKENGEAYLAGSVRSEYVWVNRVPEPQTVKNRVHLDVRFEDPHDVPGATLVREQDEEIGWRVLADPDGLQLCAFGPREGASAGAFELVVDCADADAVAAWWGARLGVPVRSREGVSYRWLEDVPGLPFAYWVFIPVPEPKTVKNRVHWDVDLVDATVEDLVATGATVVRERDDEIRWTVLADPEGNEFCAFTPEPHG